MIYFKSQVEALLKEKDAQISQLQQERDRLLKELAQEKRRADVAVDRLLNQSNVPGVSQMPVREETEDEKNLKKNLTVVSNIGGDFNFDEKEAV